MGVVSILYDQVILAAGKSSRMGFPKGLLQTPGGDNFILARSVRAREAGARKSILVLGFHRKKILEEIKPLPPHLEVVINPKPGRGQTGSFKCALEKVDYTPPVLMELVDQPPLVSGTYADYISRTGDDKINIPLYRDRRGHPPLFPGWFLEQVQEMPVDRGINSLYSEYSDRIQQVPVNDPRVLLDLDTPADYEKYREKFG